MCWDLRKVANAGSPSVDIGGDRWCESQPLGLVSAVRIVWKCFCKFLNELYWLIHKHLVAMVPVLVVFRRRSKSNGP